MIFKKNEFCPKSLDRVNFNVGDNSNIGGNAT